MNKSLLCMCVILAALMLMKNVVSGAELSSTCNNVKITGKNLLEAKCKTSDGAEVSAQLDLNKCIGTDKGVFKCQSNGNYASMCRGIRLCSGNTLKAKCKKLADRGCTNKAAMKLDECISNNNGQLACKA